MDSHNLTVDRDGLYHPLRGKRCLLVGIIFLLSIQKKCSKKGLRWTLMVLNAGTNYLGIFPVKISKQHIRYSIRKDK